MPLLDLRNLSVTYRSGRKRNRALSDVSVVLGCGDALGIVGESGCGKSTLALAVMRLLPTSAEISGDALTFDGADLLQADAETIRKARWTRMAYVPQGAMSAFDPVTRLDAQALRIWRAHGRRSDAEGRVRLHDLFEQVELDPRWLKAYPHELSGGMRQRVAIAFALIFAPRLLIADEPTTGLDVLVQREILSMLRHTCAETGLTLLFVSHDLGAIAETCRSVAVMYAGEIVEHGPIDDVLERPCHPYTMGLRMAFADPDRTTRTLVSIPGAPPHGSRPQGCAFFARCPFALPVCREHRPPLSNAGGARGAACHRAHEGAALRVRAQDPDIWRADACERKVASAWQS